MSQKTNWGNVALGILIVVWIVQFIFKLFKNKSKPTHNRDRAEYEYSFEEREQQGYTKQEEPKEKPKSQTKNYQPNQEGFIQYLNDALEFIGKKKNSDSLVKHMKDLRDKILATDFYNKRKMSVILHPDLVQDSQLKIVHNGLLKKYNEMVC